MKASRLVLFMLLLSSTGQGQDRSLGLSLGFPDVPALRLGQRWGDGRFEIFAQASAPFELLIKSYLPQKTLSKKDFVAIQNEPQDLNFRVQVASLYAAGVEWFPFQGSLYLHTGLERRRLSFASDLTSGFQFVTATGTQLSRSEMDSTLRTRTQQDLLRLAMGQRFALGSSWSLGWYCGLTEVLHSQSRVDARVSLVNRQATLRSEAAADNLQDALAMQSAQLRDLASRELNRIAAQRMPLVGLSLSLHF